VVKKGTLLSKPGVVVLKRLLGRRTEYIKREITKALRYSGI
jgi:hypothetical protein